MRTLLILPAFALAIVGAAAASFAGSEVRVDAPRDQWMTIPQIVETLTSKGYQVREVEQDDGVYEVEATDKDGKRVEVHVHPVTGEILRTELDD